MNNFQRKGSISNAHVGREFEKIAAHILNDSGIRVSINFPLSIGLEKIKKNHLFDLGSENPRVIVECKSHRWTSGNNVPSAKLTVWNEAMYYFAIAPKEYRKILFVLKDYSHSRKETLAQYYLRTYPHLIPSDVEIWEYDDSTKTAERVSHV